MWQYLSLLKVNERGSTRTMLLTVETSPVCTTLELVRRELYFSGCQMATEQSKDTISNTEDSISVNP